MTDLKTQIYKMIGRQFQVPHGSGLKFVPRASAKFFSDDFANLDFAEQIAEMGVHDITDNDKCFVAKDYNFANLYETFLNSGFEINGISQEEVNQYFEEIHKRDKDKP